MTDRMIGLLFLVSKHYIKALETRLIHLRLCINYDVTFIMIKLKLDVVRDVWFGVHKAEGEFLYDEQSQNNLKREGTIRIYLFKEDKMGVFDKIKLKKNLSKTSNTLIKEYSTKINDYIKRVKSKRLTSCFKCKEFIDSVSWKLCKECGWIKCACGSCGCTYEEGREDWNDDWKYR
jgi:hypothetical protein